MRTTCLLALPIALARSACGNDNPPGGMPDLTVTGEDLSVGEDLAMAGGT